MGRKSLGATRRQEIVESFYDVAKNIGLENASIAKVANHMNISNGLVMHYFNTKDELLIGLTEFILQQHLNVMTEGHKGNIKSREDLENLIENLFSRKWNQYFDDGVFYSCYALIYRKKAINTSFKEYLLKLHEVLKESLIKAKINGIIINNNIEELTEVIFAMIDGSYYYMGMFDEIDDSSRQQQEIYISHCLKLFEY
ncbi:TetR family transcriptional regulator [Cytophaga sp. FL35]|uniref:TetR family transcriptional regulator n=1 Tax=Cytophaga sp. FL35 TaxID=1904456 RepID=UPI0016534740|nr:TetR family transcriptional regulator [Cytophaga sp. FL35]MBC7000787.1 TetR/AcrR family transcriptional regulator [Cytophaga sp. FL35]